MSVFHSETIWHCSKLSKAKSFIKVSCLNICVNYGVKLQNSKAFVMCLFNTVFNKFFAYMKPSAFSRNRIACIAYMSASAYIVWMKNLKAVNFSCFCIFRNTAVCLLCKKFFSCIVVKKILLRKSLTLFNNLVPYSYHFFKVFFFVFSHLDVINHFLSTPIPIKIH